MTDSGETLSNGDINIGSSSSISDTLVAAFFLVTFLVFVMRNLPRLYPVNNQGSKKNVKSAK